VLGAQQALFTSPAFCAKLAADSGGFEKLRSNIKARLQFLGEKRRLVTVSRKDRKLRAQLFCLFCEVSTFPTKPSIAEKHIRPISEQFGAARKQFRDVLKDFLPLLRGERYGKR